MYVNGLIQYVDVLAIRHGAKVLIILSKSKRPLPKALLRRLAGGK